MTTYEMGRANADREMGQTHPADIRDYLLGCEEMGCAEGRDEYDRGFMSRVRELASAPVFALKRCGCGAVYSTLARWQALPFVGVQAIDEIRIEMRNCPCGSTLAIDLAGEV